MKTSVVLTIYEPRRRWWGDQMCRYRIERHQRLEGPAGVGHILVTPLAKGWLPNLGLGYRTVEMAA